MNNIVSGLTKFWNTTTLTNQSLQQTE